MLGLPDGVRAALFDLDGVLTQTAKVHAQAWKQMFDEYLGEVSQPPFALPEDYERYVDGKPRLDGVRSFLQARGIEPDPELVARLGTRKNELVLDLIRTQGVEPYEGSIRYVDAARDAGLRRAVVSSSNNTREVLEATGMLDRFEAIIDGVYAEREGLKGKPAPDGFLAGARALGVEPGEAAVFEDALAGVRAGRAGSFGYVVGVDRTDHADELREHGADIVVNDLAELLE
ncbi:MAG TPA: beta-phosphoglucomutase family hydrolase [Solirubrobacteraceae bacterium]|nr:beta-phosphoglucomutase family hydrolase [Solirubrobacteraceae bacterium]